MAKSFIVSFSFKHSSIFLGNSKISFFKSAKSFESWPNVSAKYIDNTANKTTCEVYALVDATAISGPAWV